MLFMNYLQRLSACWKSRETFDVKTGDGQKLPLGAFTHRRACFRLCRGAREQRDQTHQHTRYHVHAHAS